MERTLPLVSIVIPCRNEERFLGKCLETVLDQDYPRDRFEVMVVDGMSTDKTREIIKNYSDKYPLVRMLENPKKFTPSAFNIGVRAAKGDYIIMMGAHAGYNRDYISKCVIHAQESGSDNVGGIVQIRAQHGKHAAAAIAKAISSAFGSGNAYYKTKKVAAPMAVDTVFGGCYKREVFGRVGLFDERLKRSQDMEFNMRLKKAGGRIMLYPDIVVGYFPKDSLKDFFIHNFWDGVWAVYPLKFMKMPLRPRHYAPLFFMILLAGLAAAALFWHPASYLLAGLAAGYLALSLLISMATAIKERDPYLALLLPPAFAARHFGYGFGSVWGIIKLSFPEKHGRQKN
ncbi:MAG: glycosyltransferase family 2 protein [Candidatus Pacebacteria bacterium]|jgi:glycosyltransferase involved in cell wall biosynthesis|nr:glycosyltransferase family 2 protein [Candidatus Paceibacterota bacterium]